MKLIKYKNAVEISQLRKRWTITTLIWCLTL
jgi:hypothetical protein